MPVRPTYPGVYVEEIPSGVRTVSGVSTSVAAFIGTFPRGLVDRPVQLFGLSDFEREYGGLAAAHDTSYAVQQFFLNGGSECFVVRVASADAGTANAVLDNGRGTPIVRFVAGRSLVGQRALNPGPWGADLRVEVDFDTLAATVAADTETRFNLTVSLVRQDGDRTVTVASERYINLTMAAGAGNAIDVVNAGSTLVQLDRGGPGFEPAIAALAALPATAARPAPNGTLSGRLGTLNGPTAANNLTATLTINGVATAALAVVVPGVPAGSGVMVWAAALQTGLRAAAGLLPVVAQQAYLSEATVSVVGDGSALNPARFLVRLGRGARPFDPAATIAIGGSAAQLTLYRMDPAAAGLEDRPTVSRQAWAPTAGTATTGTQPVAAARYRGVRLTKTGMYALENVDLFNILCIPDAAAMGATDMQAVYAEAESYAEERRSMVLVDVPAAVVRLDQMQAWLAANDGLRHPNAAVYYPRTRVPDPLNGGRLRSLGASGTIAGLYARTDTQRGVWKAPAGTDARLRNVQALDYLLTDMENGALNPLGVNCLRTFPVYSSICWGARTLEGADQLASDWKYVPVRRLTLFLEESLYRGTKWVVFEPNDEPLWAQIRLNLGAFMQDLFRKGAFQGSSPRDAFFVRCDSQTTTQTDIDNGIVNIEIGFAPLKPAEFVILKVQQIARRADA
jgi:phage tail sheath protein FI